MNTMKYLLLSFLLLVVPAQAAVHEFKFSKMECRNVALNIERVGDYLRAQKISKTTAIEANDRQYKKELAERRLPRRMIETLYRVVRLEIEVIYKRYYDDVTPAVRAKRFYNYCVAARGHVIWDYEDEKGSNF